MLKWLQRGCLVPSSWLLIYLCTLCLPVSKVVIKPMNAPNAIIALILDLSLPIYSYPSDYLPSVFLHRVFPHDLQNCHILPQNDQLKLKIERTRPLKFPPPQCTFVLIQ